MLHTGIAHMSEGHALFSPTLLHAMGPAGVISVLPLLVTLTGRSQDLLATLQWPNAFTSPAAQHYTAPIII